MVRLLFCALSFRVSRSVPLVAPPLTPPSTAQHVFVCRPLVNSGGGSAKDSAIRAAQRPPTQPWRLGPLSRCHRLLEPLFLQIAPQLVDVVGRAPEQPFTVHLGQPTQQEAPQPSRFLGLTKHRLHDRFAFGVDLPAFLLA